MRYKVLLIDDDYINAARFRQMLTKRSEQCVVTVEHIDITGLRILKQLAPDILVLHENTRYVAPEEFIRTAAEYYGDIPIILITDDSDGQNRYEENRFLEFLHRSVGEEEFLARFDEILIDIERRRKPVSYAAGVSNTEQLQAFSRVLAEKYCYILRLCCVGQSVPQSDENAASMIEMALREYNAGWFREENGGICILINDIEVKGVLYSVQLLWQVIQNLVELLLSTQMGKTGKIYALISEKVSGRHLLDTYKQLLEDEKDLYFCKEMGLISSSYLAASRNRANYGAIDELAGRLYAAAFEKDGIALARGVEEIYLKHIKSAFDREAVLYCRNILSNIYHTILTTFHLFESEDMQFGHMHYEFLEEELVYVNAALNRLICQVNGKILLRAKTIEVLKYIAMHYREPISLNSIAEELQVTNTYISKIFKEDMGVGIVDFINQTRISKAKNLLTAKGESIQEIARLVGYEDPKYFGRVFKKLTGVTPTDYIKIEE